MRRTENAEGRAAGFGIIIRGVGGFYTVRDEEGGVYSCKARGVFRNRSIRPLVGDRVRWIPGEGEDSPGIITEILPRRNVLTRPAVANVDQSMIVFALRDPQPSLNLLDRFLVMMECRKLPSILVFNKRDLAGEEDLAALRDVYHASGYPLLFVCAVTGEGCEELEALLRGKTTVLAGPSGAGKSTLLNLLIPGARMETGEVSEKIGRGRHTTRHTELFCREPDLFLLDTPGFSALDLWETDPSHLQDCYPEFTDYRENCRFPDCVHVGERDCGVKDAVEEGKISRVRYENYLQLYREIRDSKRY